MATTHINVDKIGYGMADQLQAELLRQQTYLGVLFNDLTHTAFNPNTSFATKEELNELIGFVTELTTDVGMQQRFDMYDQDFSTFFIQNLQKYGLKQEEAMHLINAIERDVLPLVYQLKYYFQRPRPAQLAYYYKLRLLPFNSMSDSSPSYPSCIAVMSKVFAEIVGNKYPKIYKPLVELSGEVCISRLYMGVNYRSDIDFAGEVADKIMGNKELKLKYKI